MILLEISSGWESFFQLIGVLLIFLFVLAITYFTTKWIAGYQKGAMCNKNINVIETFRVNNNKFIQIIQIGEKYLAISVCKDTINVLTELTKEQLTWLPPEDEKAVAKTPNFQEIFEKLKGKFPGK
ncbi:flagellar biosynthetic protein FliO [Roseburia sp. 499]|uniref:flagellar biosynthetic protein FliO n=1 Tax=Roseburia sp. 499 TaxID=1261634 RepID=UPI000950E545|nr:flagellar biosynthetic protein FliO [Roseburia sp. 499]WVK71227.1 flagellar biosynthetic protein FliO [Roseburia sp. 499]